MTGHRLERYPFPLAYSAQALTVTSEAGELLDAAHHFVELTATTLAVLSLAWFRAHSLSPGGVKLWERRLEPGGISLGTWIGVAEAARKVMKDSPHDPLAQAIRKAADAALPGLRGFNPVRNAYAHGGKPRLRADQMAAASEIGIGVSAILDGVNPLTTVRLGVVRERQAANGAFRLILAVLTGPAEPFPAETMISPVGYCPGSVLLYHQGSLESVVELAPFCEWRRCPVCHRDELFYLHQRKKQDSCYFSFSTGHELIRKGDTIKAAPKPALALGVRPLGSVRSAAATGWRAAWADLASQPRRLAARVVDIAATISLAASAGVVASLAGSPPILAIAAIALPLALLYEPVTALTGGTLGKRLLRIEPVSVWDCRALSRADTIRRALVTDVCLLLPPLGIYNLAWLLWDPARQCLHDRMAASIVICGRSRPGCKI